jgi:hypothetical protein
MLRSRSIPSADASDLKFGKNYGEYMRRPLRTLYEAMSVLQEAEALF